MISTILRPAPVPVQARRPYQPWGTITFQSQDLGTTYQSLQTKIEHRRATDYRANLLHVVEVHAVKPVARIGRKPGYERTYSPFNTPQNLAMSGSYELPFGRGRTYMANANRFVDSVLGGWQLQTIIVLRSGTPYTPIVSTDRANTGVANQTAQFESRW